MGQAKQRGTYEERKQAAEAKKAPALDPIAFIGRLKSSMGAAVLRREAMAIYTPPFKYEHGYVWDANGKMVADDGGACERIARIRGWGHIQYAVDCKNTPEDLQDKIGRILAEALTDYWNAELSNDE